jgi:hypothetical protein
MKRFAQTAIFCAAALCGGADARAQSDAPGTSADPSDLRYTSAEVLVGGGIWNSDCAEQSTAPAMAFGIGLSTPLGGAWDFLLRGTFQLGLAGCGYSSPGGYYSSSYLGTNVDIASGPPPGGWTFGFIVDPLFRVHLLGASPSWVFDFGLGFGALATPKTSGLDALALLEMTIETGVVFGRRNEWEILLKLPGGMVIDGPLEIFGPANANGVFLSPLLLLVYAF